MRRKSDRRKSTEVSSPAPAMHSTRRSTRRRTSTSSSVEPAVGSKEAQPEEHLQDKVSSKEIEREIEEDNKKDPRDSSSELSEKDEHGAPGIRANKKESIRPSKRKLIQTIVEENGSQDEETTVIAKTDNDVKADEAEEIEKQDDEIEEKQAESIEKIDNNNFEEVAQLDQNVEEISTESKDANKQNDREEGEMNSDSDEDNEKLKIKYSEIAKTEETEKEVKALTEICPPVHKPPRRRRFDERPEDVEKNKKFEEERLQENEKVNDVSPEVSMKENENYNQTSINVTISSIKKRRWLSQKSSESKPKVLAITTDSLKDIISDVPLPVPLSDVRLESSPEPEEIPILEEKINVDIDEEDLEDTNINRVDKSKEKEKVKNRDRDINMREKKSKERESRPEKESRKERQSEEVPILSNRKISIINEEEKQAMTLARPPSPPKNASSTILYITNLVRPFTVLQLKGLLARTGKIVENGFWIDKIKSKCYVQYETEDQAIETRHALHGVRWPPSNPKCLNVDFGSSAAMQKAIASTAEEIIRLNSDSSKENRTIIGTGWEKERFDNEERKNLQVSRPIREWDVGKKEELERDGRRNRERERSNERQKNDRERYRDRERGDRDRERERDRSDRDPEKDRRRYSTDRDIRDRRRSESGSPIRKFKRKENDPPIRLLDDLFRKTKTTPCIYWLPLTPEQIAEKEEARRKRIEENEKLRKEREKERERREKERERERERENERRREKDKSSERDRRRSRSRDRRRY